MLARSAISKSGLERCHSGSIAASIFFCALLATPYLTKFISEILPEELPDARDRFDDYSDLLRGYAIDGMSYEEFAARVRRREQGTKEDDDWEDQAPF